MARLREVRGRTPQQVAKFVDRDQARLYVKQVRDGESEIALSPEEQEAVDMALAPLRDAA